MTTVVERVADRLPRIGVRPQRMTLPQLLPIVAIIANAVAFFILRPGVNDLWAARARASAARHGVGLFYWFGWFGGGSTPGNYSVLTPFVSAWLSAELVDALSAVAVVVVLTVLLRGSRHQVAGCWVGVVGAAANMWSGRVPFLFGAAFAVLAFLALRYRKAAFSAAFGALSVLCSPVSGAFIALSAVATFVPTSMKSYRRISAITAAAVAVSMVLVAIVFGNPGPQHFSHWLLLEYLSGLVPLLLARPPEYLRFLVWLSMLVGVAIYIVPNGLGSNLMRWAWFFLPVAIVATSARRSWVVALLVAPIVGAGVQSTVADLANATHQTSSVAYFAPLGSELDRLSDLNTYRVEVVTNGSHAGDDTLLTHAMLARGWETQEDDALNGVLTDKQRLNADSYKVWLNNNAVGYVAMPRAKLDNYAEYTMLAAAPPPYLHEIWSSKNWVLYRVADPVPVIAQPATIVKRSQSRLTVRVPCACTKLALRVRYSKYLAATNVTGGAPNAVVRDDGSGWSTLTTTVPGTYYLQGSIAGIFR